MLVENIEKLPLHEIMVGMRGRFIHSENITLVFWEIEKGFILPEHNHPNEQITQITEGTFELTIEGATKLLENGSVTIIPSYAMHYGKALTNCKILDIFSPKRDDYNL